jgi:hypothetical protein
MLRNGLPRDGELACQLGRRRGLAFRQVAEDAPPVLVGERVEHRTDVGH